VDGCIVHVVDKCQVAYCQELSRSRTPLNVQGDDQVESEAERRFWSAYVRIRPPELAGLIPQYKTLRYRLDFAIPHRKIAIEIDGYKYHSDKETFIRDRDRHRDLEEAGWRITRFAGKRACDEPDQCVRDAARWASAIRGGG
jgi:very-short-patch-repair endonuclease